MVWWKEEKIGSPEASNRVSVFPLTFSGIVVKDLFFHPHRKYSNTCLTSHMIYVRIKGDTLCKCFINRRFLMGSSQSVNDSRVLTHFGLCINLSRPLCSESAEVQVAEPVESNSTSWLLQVLKQLPNKDTKAGQVQCGAILCQSVKWIM